MDQNEHRVITGVTIRFEGKTWYLPRPNRHHDVVRLIAEYNGVGVNGPDVQGFKDDRGNFLNRREAMLLAQANGQLNETPEGIRETSSSRKTCGDHTLNSRVTNRLVFRHI